MLFRVFKMHKLWYMVILFSIFQASFENSFCKKKFQMNSYRSCMISILFKMIFFKVKVKRHLMLSFQIRELIIKKLIESRAKCCFVILICGLQCFPLSLLLLLSFFFFFLLGDSTLGVGESGGGGRGDGCLIWACANNKG